MTEPASNDPSSTQPLTLIPSRIKWVVMIIGGVCFGAILFLQFAGNSAALIMAALAEAVAILGATMLLPGSNALQLDAHGFAVTHLFRTRRYRWSDVSDFGVCSLGQSGDVVAFKTADPPRGLWGRANASLLGDRNAYLPDTYGMKAEELAKLMTSRQSQAPKA